MSNFRLGTERQFREELTILLDEYDIKVKLDNFFGVRYKHSMKGKSKKKVTTDFLIDLNVHGFLFFYDKNWLIIS